MQAKLVAITALVGLRSLAYAAPPPTSPRSCEPLPAAAPDTALVRLDVDGDGVTDQIVPTECDGRTNCTLAVFLTRRGCALAFGSVKGDPRSLARTKRPFLPLRSNGIRLLWTHEDLHHAASESVWAWSGDRWLNVFNSYSWFDANHPDDQGEETGVPESAAAICLDDRPGITALQLRDDGLRAAVYRVPCAHPADTSHGCGNWVTITRGRCHAPFAVLSDGTVELVPRAAGDVSAVLRVRNGAHIVDYRVDPSTSDPFVAPFSLAASRSCTPASPAPRCAAWAPIVQPPAME
jgi:hypothetical protein